MKQTYSEDKTCPREEARSPCRRATSTSPSICMQIFQWISPSRYALARSCDSDLTIGKASANPDQQTSRQGSLESVVVYVSNKCAGPANSLVPKQQDQMPHQPKCRLRQTSILPTHCQCYCQHTGGRFSIALIIRWLVNALTFDGAASRLFVGPAGCLDKQIPSCISWDFGLTTLPCFRCLMRAVG